MYPVGNKSSENDFIGPHYHQKLNGWDYVAAVPILGNVTSLFRTIINFTQVVGASKDKKSSPQYKANLNGLKKASIESAPIIGTIFAIYLIYKDHNKNKNIEGLRLPPQDIAHFMEDDPPQATFNRSVDILSTLELDSYGKKANEESNNSANYIKKILEDENLEEGFRKLLSQAEKVFREFEFADSGELSQNILAKIDNLEFKSIANQYNHSNNENISKIIENVSERLDKLKNYINS